MALGRQLTIAELAFDSDTLKKLRAQTERAFLLAAWNTKVYPRTGESDSPTADVRPKGKARTLGSIRAYARGATIRSPGQMLAIPLRAAGPRYAGRGKTPIGPQEWQRRTGIKLSPARIGGKLYLVANAVRSKKTGRVAVKSTQRRLLQGRSTERLLVFLLLDELTIKRRVNIDPIFARAGSYLTSEFEQQVRLLMARTGQ